MANSGLHPDRTLNTGVLIAVETEAELVYAIKDLKGIHTFKPDADYDENWAIQILMNGRLLLGVKVDR